MGCSYDILGARIRPEHKKQFIKMFNKILKDDLYDDWCVADDVCLSIRNCIKRAPKSTVPCQHRFGFEKPCFCSL